MKRKPPLPAPTVVAADPGEWSAKSQGSVAAHFCTEYRDIAYRCRYCGEQAVFTAREQKRVYEVQKTHIDVQRVLCEVCYVARAGVARKVAACEAQWAQGKRVLVTDAGFLTGWRDLLVEHYRYGARPNGAAIAMLEKALGKLGDQSPS